MRVLGCLVAVLLGGVTLGSSTPAQAQDAARGRVLYGTLPGSSGLGSCMSCHGEASENRSSVLRGAAGGEVIARVMNAVGAMGYLRAFLTERDLADISAYLASVESPPPVAPPPRVGPVDADFAPLDEAALAQLAKLAQPTPGTHPGLTVVLAVDDRIVYAQGYGWADRQQQVPASPWLEQRLAGVSRTLTAAAVMRLVEQGRLTLDGSAWAPLASELGGAPADARLAQVTVRQLLTHSWGLDPRRSSDPASAGDADCRSLLQRELPRLRLDFSPGTQTADNHTGYCWLTRLAELIDTRPLPAQLTQWLGPEALSSGLVRLGEVAPARLTPAEVRYGDALGGTVSPALAALAGSAGWVASPLTLTRFLQRLAGARAPALLSVSTWATMSSEQALADGTPNLGLGLQTRPAWPGAVQRRLFGTGQLPGAQVAWLSSPRRAGGPLLTLVVASHGGHASGDLAATLLEPLWAALDRVGVDRLALKPEISGERLIAWGSSSEAYFVDLLLDWGERVFPQLLAAPAAAAGVAQGYRFRYYRASDTYVGIREGRVFLLQPSVSSSVVPVGGLLDFLPQAVSWAAAQPRPASAARPPPPRPPAGRWPGMR